MQVTFDASNPKLAGAFGITLERVNELADANEKFLEENCLKPNFDFGQCIRAALDRANTIEEVGFLMWVIVLNKDHINALVQLNVLQAKLKEQGGDHDN